VTAILPIIRVADVIPAIRFYTENLGFCDGWTVGDPPSSGGVTIDNISILFARADNVDARGHDALTIIVEDVDSYHSALLLTGVRVLSRPRSRPSCIRDFVIRNLDGYSITIAEIIRDDTDPPKPG